jgi:formamidopyrimidine-DNA glycosylase
MIELPESNTLARQLSEVVKGKTILNVTANKSPHKFAWFTGDPNDYHNRLAGKKILSVNACGGMVELQAEDIRLVFSEGVNIRYFEPGAEIPKKHQLHIEFDDFSALVCYIQMYGALLALGKNQTETYNEIAKSKPSPLTEAFDRSYFNALYTEKDGKLSAKEFLAAKQRIPGLGNGVLQDILFNAGIHPKRKMSTLSEQEYDKLFDSVKNTLAEMTVNGGRDTEKDIFGCNGGYKTILCSKTKDFPCPVCGSDINKETFLGGNIYYCPTCQKAE